MLFFSHELFANYPATNVATIIPAIDKINEILAINTLSTKYSAFIHMALSVAYVGKKMLNHYYEKTDLSTIY